MADTLITIDLSGSGGLVERIPGIFDNHEDRTILKQGSSNQYADGIVNPIPRLGYLSPATAEVADATAGTSLSLIGSTIVYGQTDSLWFYERDEDLWLRTSNTEFNKKNTVPGATGIDLEFYTKNGVRTLFYSYKFGTTGGIGVYTNGVFDNDWSFNSVPTTLAMGANEIKMEVADNGFMYAIDGSAVHKIDGTTDGGANGTITANVLLFPANFVLKDLVDANGFMWFALTKTADPTDSSTTKFSDRRAGVYVWDRSSVITSSSDFIPVDGVREIKSMHSFQGGLLMFTISTSNKVQIRIYNGKEFQVIRELGRNEAPNFHDSVSNTGDRLVWVAQKSGLMWTYGRITPNGNNVLMKVGDMSREGVIGTGEAFAEGGAILNINQLGFDESYITSVRNANYAVLQAFPLHGNGPVVGWATVADGEFFTLVKDLPKLAFLKEMTIYFPAQALAGSITNSLAIMDVDVYVNNSSTTIKSVTLTGEDRRKGYKRFLISKEGVNNFQLGLGWKEGVTAQYTITPSHVEVTFDPSPRRKI